MKTCETCQRILPTPDVLEKGMSSVYRMAVADQKFMEYLKSKEVAKDAQRVPEADIYNS